MLYLWGKFLNIHKQAVINLKINGGSNLVNINDKHIDSIDDFWSVLRPFKTWVITSFRISFIPWVLYFVSFCSPPSIRTHSSGRWLNAIRIFSFFLIRPLRVNFSECSFQFMYTMNSRCLLMIRGNRVLFVGNFFKSRSLLIRSVQEILSSLL